MTNPSLNNGWPACNREPFPVDPLRLANLTPHPIVLFVDEMSEDDWTIITVAYIVPPSGIVPRVEMTRHELFDLAFAEDASVPVRATMTGAVVGLPDPAPGKYLIVSRQVTEAARDRGDLLVVDETVRDNEGRIIGARALASLAGPDVVDRFRRWSYGMGEFFVDSDD
jgi:hypothetical protein